MVDAKAFAASPPDCAIGRRYRRRFAYQALRDSAAARVPAPGLAPCQVRTACSELAQKSSPSLPHCHWHHYHRRLRPTGPMSSADDPSFSASAAPAASTRAAPMTSARVFGARLCGPSEMRCSIALGATHIFCSMLRRGSWFQRALIIAVALGGGGGGRG